MAAVPTPPNARRPLGRPRWRVWWRVGALIAALAALGIAAVPALVEYRLWRGRVELAERNPQAALEHFRAAERIDSDRAETHFWLARASRKLGDLDAVRRHLEKARRLGYEDRERLSREWRLVLAETGRIREVESYLAAMLMNPGEDSVEICEAFATGYSLSLRFNEALALLDAWQADHPEDFRPHLRRGQIYAGNEQWTEAEAAFREALRRAPDAVAARRQLARALLAQGELEEAERHLRAVLGEEPTDVETLLSLGRLLRDRKEYAEAIKLARRALEREPRNFVARSSLAEFALAADDAEEAVRQAAPLVELWPEDLKSRYVLAQALRAAGRMEEAEFHFRTYASFQSSWARLEGLKRQVNERANDPELRYELGLLLLRHVSRSEGVAWLQSVFQYKPDHAGAHRALAEYYEKVGEPELARRHRRASVASLNSAELAAGPSPQESYPNDPATRSSGP